MNWLTRFLDEPLPSGAPLMPVVVTWPRDEVLEALCAGLPPEDAQALREERAGIMEYQGGLGRKEAELRAGLTNQLEKAI